jgi:hypothetical protein
LSTIPPISKQHYVDGNPGPGLRWAQQCGGVKLVNEILILSPLFRSPMTIQIAAQLPIAP